MKGDQRRLLQRCMVALGSLLLSVLVTARSAPQQEAGSSPTASQSGAVGLLRLVNTAEVKYHERFGNFATRSQLLESRIPQGIADEMAQRRNTPSVFQPPPDLNSPDPAPGYAFALYASADGSDYLASLRDKSEDPCAPSFYTDKRGVILQGKAIGCK